MGILDSAFRSAAEQMTNLFTNTEATISIITSYYDSTNDETTTIRRDESLKVTPPTPVSFGHMSVGQLQGDPEILSTDQVVYVDAKSVEALRPEFDPRPASGKTVYVRLQGRDHKMIRVRDWKSGDQTALLEFILRS